MQGLLGVIADYDRSQAAYIAELERENERLRNKNRELVDQLVSYTQTVDRMKLQLIMSGALQRPAAKETRLVEEIVTKCQ